MSTPRVTAILVVHDGATWLPEVVASITSQVRTPDHIIAVDTGSTDSSAKLLKVARIPTITLDRSASFGEAINAALAEIPEVANVENWIWLLHDDCSFEPHALEELLKAVEEKPNVAMVGPKLLGWHDRTHLLEVGISIAPNGARWTELEPHEYDQGQHDGSHESLAVSTAGALIRREVFVELGGFDLSLGLFRDDVDFGWRLNVAGFSALAVSDAIGFHAQAAATERRSIDVKDAFLHRPLLLDRRNAAYVLLANCSWWKFPLLALQLLAGAVFRSLGYLFAKLPGYAADELLAIATLILRPNRLLNARKVRREKRFVAVSTVKKFIPSRWEQLRNQYSRSVESVRTRLLPDIDDEADDIPSELELSNDEEMLAPIQKGSWLNILKKPLVIAHIALFIITLGWARHRFGAISGGGLAQSPGGVSDLLRFYFESWHEVGLGSNESAPVWLLPIAMGSMLTFGNVALFLSLFFIIAPFAALWSAHSVLKRYTTSPNLSAGASFIYAFSPVLISAINAGRLGAVLFVIALPLFIQYRGDWVNIENRSVRNAFAQSLFIAFLASYNPALMLVLLFLSIFLIYRDLDKAGYDYKNELFGIRIVRRLVLLITPGLLLAPQSFTYLFHPSRMLYEIGFGQSGGSTFSALLSNPGGPGSLPWWCLSPITLLLIVTYFSIADAQKFAQYGLGFLAAGSIATSLPAGANGSTELLTFYAGPLLAIATFLALIAAVIMFTDVRSRLEQTHINYQHFAVALVLIVSIFYASTASLWVFSAGSNSPLQNNSKEVLPAFLAIEKDAKTLVVRSMSGNDNQVLQYFVSRGSAVTIGQPDVSLPLNREVNLAVRGLIDDTGINSSSVFSLYGIKYIFATENVSQRLIQTIDGLGGFSRTSSTDLGTVWKVVAPTGSVTLTDISGKRTILEKINGKVIVSSAGLLTLSEHASSSWQAMSEGSRLEKIQNEINLPQFKVTAPGEVIFIHDGTLRRGWISLFVIALITAVVMALPSGRRRREMREEELS